ncbi:fibronectin type III domain-containing protein [Flavobacterium sp.]|uniref:fibronectin type III domain-containing protein n=1 Tax=Flavobacterium sp. TaxID=239 RepID=UPI002FDDF5D5
MIKNYLIKNLLLSLNKTLYFVFFIAFFLFTDVATAQTTIISPTGDGGFENATVTMAANGWSATTSSSGRNQWICGNGANAYPGFSGSFYAYITNTTTATTPANQYPHTYTLSTNRVTHLFRNVTIPSGETNITLSFNWIGVGESGFDYLRVWAIPTSTTLTYGSAITASGSAPTGNVLLTPSNLSGQASWTTATYTLDSSYAGTSFRLVFEWTNNNNNIGTNPPAGVDNISLVSTPPVGCTTPSQATAYTPGTKTSTSLPATFSGSAHGYLVIQSTSSTPPSQPTNGITYSAANINTLGSGLTFVQSSASTSIPGTGLAGNTQYYYYIYAYNNTACTGGPVYATGGALSGNGITCPAVPNSVTVSGTSASGFTLNWAAPTGGSASAITYTVQVTTDAGYTTNVSGSPFTTGSLSQVLSGLSANTTYYYRILAGNSCSSAYVTGSTTTSAGNPCSSAVTLACGTTNLAGTTIGSTSYTHGTGCTMSNYGKWYTFVGDGNQNTITVTTTNFDVEMAIASGTCGSLSNITCQDVGFSSGTETYTFIATLGVTYYVYVAYYGSSGTATDTGTFTISRTCTTPFNPCASTPTIAACGTNTTATIAAGSGAYNTSACGWSTPGQERIFVFTPTTTGNYTITQSSSYTYIDYQYKPVSAECDNTGWTCIDDISGAGTSPSFSMTAGTSYYILLDPESSLGGNVTFTISCPPAPITNDECSGAIALTPTTTCNYTTYSNATATASSGIPAPGCASYSGGDVWFYAVVPATGILTVDLQAGTMTDSGMAFYTGTCGALTLLECDDDDSTNGLMSNITMVGLTPGQTIYIRVWEYGNDNNGTFSICATTPSCPQPSDLFANILSTTSASIYWTASTPPASGGYQYYVSTSNTTPSASATPTGSTAPGVIGVTLTGLTAGQSYYFWVRSYCGGSDTSAWFGPTNFTPCAVGNGTGTTTLACPSVTVGGLGLNGADPAAMSCNSLGCVNLEATYLQVNQPTNYTVASIPYAPPYQFSCLQNPVSVNIDDRWSPIINLPFNFCFFGNNYDKCLIGSNGTITFDTTNNTPGGYSAWSFNTDLPSTSLFRNTIFGVYQDIDPSVGGKVSWELITLNTGCRALVASWHEIPMFSSTCNNLLYTGMIVLYENTNVIEVYIKQKDICSTWNDGNAIVGLQNAAGTTAVVAPNRNGLSTNWSATNEAWRFTPSGTSLTSVKWFQGNVASGPVLGTSNTLNVCPLATTTYTAEVTYAMCNGTNLTYTDNTTVTVTGGKVWTGAIDTDWNKAGNWLPNNAIPTGTDCVVIPNTTNKPIVSGTSYNALAGTLSVYANALLTINSNNSITVTDWVNVQTNGTFLINNNASLVQINNVTNTGNIVYKRDAFIRSLDYVYWSSPVAGFNVSNIASPLTAWGIYKWNTTIANSNGGQGNWENAAGNTMIAGKGYIVSGPSSFSSTTAATLNGVFTGVPNNGTITVPIARGSDTNTATHYGLNGAEITNYSDNWNLVGNPYPSAIRASQFLFDNNTKIMGNIKLWTHGNLPSVSPSPFYGSFISNYSPGDYVTYNFTGTSCCPTAASDLFIGSGQGFFVQMIDGPADSSQSITFTNSLRSATYSNSSFYRLSNYTGLTAGNNVNQLERNRIWLDIVGPNGQSDRTLFGYIQEATMGKDSFFDCLTQNSGITQIYSLIEGGKFSIQGRELPFDVNDEVPIGVNIPNTGNYTIAIAAVDGLFDSQNIYLKDQQLGIIHDLKVSPYQFTANNGVIENRFSVIYLNGSLGVNNATTDNSVKAIIKDQVSVASNNLQMEAITVYNALGQQLDLYENINTNYFTLSNLRKNNTTLLLKVKLQTGETVVRKVIY